jgi:hypothetical protein
MQASTFLARLLGPVLVALGLGVLLNRGAVLGRTALAVAGAMVWTGLGALLCFFGYVRPHPSHGSI